MIKSWINKYQRWNSTHMHISTYTLLQTHSMAQQNKTTWCCRSWLSLVMSHCLNQYQLIIKCHTPDSKVHVANMGPIWVLSAPGGPHVGPMSLAIRDHMSESSIAKIKNKIFQPGISSTEGRQIDRAIYLSGKCYYEKFDYHNINSVCYIIF